MFPRVGDIQASLFCPFQVTSASLAAPAPLTVFGQPFLLGGPFGHQSAGLLQEGRGRAAEPLPLEALPLTPARSQLWLLSLPQRHGLALTIWYTSPNWGGGRGGGKAPAGIHTC